MTKKEEDTWGKEEMRTRGGHEEEMRKWGQEEWRTQGGHKERRT